MATAPVTPSAPAAAAPASVSSPAPVSAPVSTPAAAPAPAAAPSAPAVTIPQPPTAPDPSTFGNATDWYMADVEYRQKFEAFKAENPDWKEPAPAEVNPAEVETKPAEAETKPAEPETVDPNAEQYSMQDEPSLTPQALNDLIKNDDALKAALEANPAAKNQLFKMAREHAELAQFRGIFPNAQAATFAQKTATETVALKHKFQMASTPEAMADVFDAFAQQFVETDSTGKPIIDPETGGPKLGDDYYAYHEHVIERYIGSTMEEIDARLAANQYASDDERERDSDMKLALNIIKGDLHPEDSAASKADLSNIPPEIRAKIEEREAKVKAAEEALEAKNGAAKKQDRATIQKEGTQKFYQECGTRVFQQVDKIVDSLRKAGAVIPDWQLTTPLPGGKVSAFRNAIGNEIQNAIQSDPHARQNMLDLEVQYIANPTPENMAARVAAFDAFVQERDHTGKSFLNRAVTKLVRKFGQQVQESAANGRTDTAPNASKEPTAGGAPKPVRMTSDDAYRAAEKILAKEVHGWENMGQSEKMAMIMPRQRQILSAR